MGRVREQVTDQFSAIFGNRRGAPAHLDHEGVEVETPQSRKGRLTEHRLRHRVSVAFADSATAAQFSKGMRDVPSAVAPGFEHVRIDGSGVISFYVYAPNKVGAEAQLLAACAYLGQKVQRVEAHDAPLGDAQEMFMRQAGRDLRR